MALGACLGASMLLFILLSLLPLSHSSPVTSDTRRISEDLPSYGERQDGYFSVLGVAGVGGTSLHPRLEIRDLERNADQWNIYLLGLRRLQGVDQGDKLSYYQVAGIHGRPYKPWDGVNIGPPGSGGGYCPHSSNLFPTWHRPYLALIEELLYLNIRQSIEEFPNGALKDRYNDALRTFRMPYWDWAAPPPSGEGLLPWSLQRPTIDVVLANGTANVNNPLYSYRFHPLITEDFVDRPWTMWNSTLRDPSNRDDPNAASRNDLVALALDSNRLNLQSRVFDILAIQHGYSKISNDQLRGDSLEAVHNLIHNLIGGGGHMSVLPVSAFDPVFWLHHGNIDRIFAIWQVLNPNEYIRPQTNTYATFTTPGGSSADANTPLTPFHLNDAGDFWTSNSVRSTTTFAYTYPELLDLATSPDANASTSDLVSRLNALYGPNAPTPQKRSSISESHHHIRPRAIAGAPNFSGRRKYTVNVKTSKFIIGGSVNIYIFLGEEEPGKDVLGWIKEDGFVGVAGMLSAAEGMRMGDHGTAGESHAEVPLTAALEAKVRVGELAGLQEGIVAEYLRRNLKWRVGRMDNQELSISELPSLQISVLWAEIEPAKSESEFPKMVGEEKLLVEATDGRPGGFAGGETL